MHSSPLDPLGGWKEVSYKKKSKGIPRGSSQAAFSIFLYDIPDTSTGKDIWGLFKECGKIIDIILPRKRDIKGKRFGFVHTTDEKEAGAIINNAKMDRRLGSKIKMTINETKRRQGMNADAKKDFKEPQASNQKKEKEPKRQEENSEDTDFSKKLFEFTEVEVDEEVESALLGYKIGYTWFEESTKGLQEKLDDIGLSKYKVTSLAPRKFFIRKNPEESWEDFIKTDLSVWFCSIRNYEEFDHIISRLAWVECRGLPMPAWKDENLKAFTSRLGKWISWSYQSDDLGDFFNPLICTDTRERKTISDSLTILYKGRNMTIDLVEIVDYKALYDKVLPMEVSENKSAKKESTSSLEESVDGFSHKSNGKGKSDSKKSTLESQDSPTKAVLKPHHNLALIEIGHSARVLSPSVNETSTASPTSGKKGSNMPCTPKAADVLRKGNVLIAPSVAAVIRSQLQQAMARHSIFFVLILFLFISVTYAASDDRSDESGVYIVYMGGKGSSTSGTLRDDQAQLMNLFLKSGSQTVLCTDVHKKLKLKSNRGRPRKAVKVPKNPFEIGIRFKNKRKKQGAGRKSTKSQNKLAIGNCTQIIPIGLVGSSVKEALEILKSAEYMGLEIKGDREEVVKNIAQRLDSGEI
ncbi:hypothetical protein ACET3Z_026013 [Daucus carota]